MKTTPADTCLYGSVVGMDQLLALDRAGNQAEEPSPLPRRPAAAVGVAASANVDEASSSSMCDECEQHPAALLCEECGLLYCKSCDAHRHRKGKLISHQRATLQTPSLPQERANSASDWSVTDVCTWLETHDLALFVDEAQTKKLDGAALLSPGRLERFLDAAPGVSRGYKKKLQREAHKLQSKTASQPESESVPVAASAKSPLPPHPARPGGTSGSSNSMRRIGVDLRVNVGPQPPTPAVRPAPQGQDKTGLPFGLKQLQIDVSDAGALSTGSAAGESPIRTGNRSRQPPGGLDLDIMQVKREETAVTASFDFSATGRLQTQGFEINTRGIANVPFQSKQQETDGNKPTDDTTLGTRECLLLLDELGHGAGGKVYKALYMPTFRLVAVKVIRVYDQKKRHQMVRELKSLYVNFVPIATATIPVGSTTPPTQAACEELVVFYDAYTNPEAGSVAIVLEYMDGGSLEDYLHAGSGDAGEGCLSEKEIANVAACGLKGLAFLHEHHQLHRDIKLSNMLINRQGQVKISDFGISRDLESTLAKATTFTGTLLYMAPERISGGMYSYPSDLWSFGLAVMACAIGKLPVPTKDGYWGVVHAVQEQPSPRLTDYGDRFSPALCDFLDQCLQKNPMLRPPAARLLEHPFITQNYSPREQQDARQRREQRPLTPKALERSRQELQQIASKARVWCQEHASVLRRLAGCGSHGDAKEKGFTLVSNRVKIEALAQQLRLSVDEVAPHFAFLDEYCD